MASSIPTISSVRRAKARAERIRRGVALVLTAMSRGATLQMSYERGGRGWCLSDGTPVIDAVGKLVSADHRVIGTGDALLRGLPSQTYRYIEE